MEQAAAPLIYTASPDFVAKAHVDGAMYEAMYKASVADPDAFCHPAMQYGRPNMHRLFSTAIEP